MEGEAAKVTDDAELRQMAKRYSSEGWQVTLRDGAFDGEYSAPRAGPPPWHLYRFTPRTVFALGTAEPCGATRWRFESED